MKKEYILVASKDMQRIVNNIQFIKSDINSNDINSARVSASKAHEFACRVMIDSKKIEA